MKQNPDSQPTGASLFAPEVLKGLYDAEHRPSHDQKWEELEAADAPLARSAITHANDIEADPTITPREAYLRGIADYHVMVSRQKLLDELGEGFDPNILITGPEPQG